MEHCKMLGTKRNQKGNGQYAITPEVEREREAAIGVTFPVPRLVTSWTP